MKKLFLYIVLLLSIGVSSCDKGLDDNIYSEGPDDRLSKTLTSLQEKLVSAPNGWKAFIYPQAGGSYSYFLEFNNNNRVTMYSDFSDESSSVAKESSYRLKALQQPSLIFDTYSYIHIPANPKASVNGGTNGRGLGSDFEFAYDPTQAEGDTIRLKGRFNETDFIMIRATQAEAASYRSGGLNDLIYETLDFIDLTENPYLELPDGIKKAFTMNIANKTLSLGYVDGNGTLINFQTSFAFTTTGIFLGEPIVYNGVEYYELLWDATQKVYYLVVNGQRINVQSNPVPLIPIRFYIGTMFDVFSIPPPSGLPGSSTTFQTAYNGMKSNLNLFPLGLQWVDFFFDPATNKMQLQIYITQGANLFLASYNFTYTVDDQGVFKFTYVNDGNGNGTTIAAYVAIFVNFIKNDHFVMDYYKSGGTLLGLMTSVENPGFYFTGNLE